MMKLKSCSELMDEEKSDLKIENEKVDLFDFSSKTKKKNEWEDYHEKLLKVLKKEVKQIMEEVVTKKFVNEDSSSIVSLCAAIDSCLSHGLKRRALGLFKTNSTTALLQKMAKNCDEAAKVYKIVTEVEKVLPRGSSSSSDSLSKFRLSLIKQSNTSNNYSFQNTNSYSVNQQNTSTKISSPRYFWIRVALFEKQLYKIVEHLVSNSTIYYEKEALVSDLVNGQILISLLLGPCTLDYTKIKYQDQFWVDPPADELVQRHNLISSPASSCSSSPLSKTMSNSRKAPLYLPYYKWFNFISTNNSNETNSLNQTLETEETDSSPVHQPLTQHLSLNSPFSPKEYVESLHQNYKTTLLYGKNNVWVQPNDDAEALTGYLSLHQINNNLEIKWTPNQLMKGAKTNEENKDTKDKSSFWDYALIINVEDTVYLHCHHSEEGGLAVFIGHDGVQKPPIRFPKGSHLLSFLTCLEAGLMPHGQLDPPLGLQKGKGKVFPLLKHRSKTVKKEKIKKKKSNDLEEDVELYEEIEKTTNDYVFRIITSLEKPESISEEMFNPKMTGDHFFSKKKLPWKLKPNLKQKLESTSSNSSTNSSKSLSEEAYVSEVLNTKNSSSSIKTVCETMKKQIVSRAFYGWLAHCRHLKTVRTHLSALVNTEIIKNDNTEFSQGLTNKEWIDLIDHEGKIKNPDRLLKLVYFGYCEPSLRSKVWPFLLGHYEFNSTENERFKQDEEIKQNYELLITECLAVEAIVKQRDKENLTANLAKFTNDKNSKSELIDKNIGFENKSEFNNEDVIEENENEINEENEDIIDKNNGKSKNDKKINSKIESLKRQNNFCTQSSTQYASKQILITDASVDLCRNNAKTELIDNKFDEKTDVESNYLLGHLNDSKNEGQLSAEHSTCVSPASSNGGVYTNELLDLFSLNMHRIDKDVQRCDRNYYFFQNTANLEKLRNIICTYVWKNLQDGYVQGMCDLVAPLLVILDNEMLAYSCFCELMKRMSANFPYQGLMDIHFANMRSLIQVLDPELFKLMHSNGDYTHFYFCYRWFLLDFKREFNYEDVFKVWEVIWSGKNVASSNMVLFLALSLVQQYREIILENNMDFTDIIKFFNEMAERHDANSIIENARQLVFQIQALIN